MTTDDVTPDTVAGEEMPAYDCVVDASVGIKLFLVEPLAERADALFAHLADDPPARLYVPDLFFVECANVLWKYVQRFDYAVEVALQDVQDLTSLPLQTVPMAALAEEALAIACRFGSTAYDSAYVALARRLELPLVTADAALVQRFDGTGLDVRALAEWPPLA
jgi:predicted nucleic acid-binding protein